MNTAKSTEKITTANTNTAGMTTGLVPSAGRDPDRVSGGVRGVSGAVPIVVA